MPKLKIPERDNLKAIKDYLTLQGFQVCRLHSGGLAKNGRFIKMGCSGLPDLLAVHKKCPIFFLEAKGSNGKLSLKQQEMIALLNKAGLNGVVAKAVWSLDEVVDLIEQFKK